MPQLLIIMVTTTFSLAGIRKRFPDEERGVRNSVMSSLGIEPPGIPAPSGIQPYWSGAPLRLIKQDSDFNRLGLHEVFDFEEEEEQVESAKSDA